MPAELARKERRASRLNNVENDVDPSSSDTRQRDLEIKRARGEISCAECRRLKLKCDRKLPCSSCVRRGCTSICPNGALSTGQGSRFVLADTEQLHRKLTQMSERIRQLEDALAILQKACSNQAHPLLDEELLTIKHSVLLPEDHEEPEAEEVTEVTGDFGTLTIHQDGSSRFVGATGGAEIFQSLAMLDDGPDEEMPHYQIPHPLFKLQKMWPFPPFSAINLAAKRAALLDLVLDQAPPRDRAYELANNYCAQLAWFFRGVSRDELFEEILPGIYDSEETHGDKPVNPYFTRLSPHDVAMFFMIMAAGAMTEPDPDVSDELSDKYMQLCRASLALHGVFDRPSLSTVQTLGMMAIYYVIFARKAQTERGYLLFQMAFSLCSSLGLHRDPERWHLEPKLIQRRRRIYWELYSSDKWQSLASGRPVTMSVHFVDTKFANDIEGWHDEKGVFYQTPWSFRANFGKEILGPLAMSANGAEPLKFSEVLRLDQKIRDYKYPICSWPVQSSNKASDTAFTSVMKIFPSMCCDTVLLYLHRYFFVKTLVDHPDNPLRSQYAPSFLAAYRSSTNLLKNMRDLFEREPRVVSMFNNLWVQTIASTVVVGTVVIKGPNSTYASTAFIELCLAVGLFERAQTHSSVVSRSLPVLLRLRDKAQSAYAHRGADNVQSTAVQVNVRRDQDCDDELAILGGHSRSFIRKDFTDPKASPSSSTSSPASTMSNAGMSPDGMQMITAPDKQPPSNDVPAVSQEQYRELMQQLLAMSETMQVPTVVPQGSAGQAAVNPASNLAQPWMPSPSATASTSTPALPQQQGEPSQQQAPRPLSLDQMVLCGGTPSMEPFPEMDPSLFPLWSSAVNPGPTIEAPAPLDDWYTMMMANSVMPPFMN